MSSRNVAAARRINPRLSSRTDTSSKTNAKINTNDTNTDNTDKPLKQVTITSVLNDHELRMRKIEKHNDDNPNIMDVNKMFSNIKAQINEQHKQHTEEVKRIVKGMYALQEKYDKVNELYMLQSREFLRFKEEMLNAINSNIGGQTEAQTETHNNSQNNNDNYDNNDNNDNGNDNNDNNDNSENELSPSISLQIEEPQIKPEEPAEPTEPTEPVPVPEKI